MPLYHSAGSTGYTSAARVERLIDHFYSLPVASQTSATFANFWSSRAVHYLDLPTDYIIPEEANTAAGWLAYVKRLHNSTANTSTRGVFGTLALPSPVWRDFLADRSTLQAVTSAITGVADGDTGRRLYQFLASTVIDNARYRRGGQYRELLVAWAAGGTSAAPTS